MTQAMPSCEAARTGCSLSCPATARNEPLWHLQGAPPLCPFMPPPPPRASCYGCPQTVSSCASSFVASRRGAVKHICWQTEHSKLHSCTHLDSHSHVCNHRYTVRLQAISELFGVDPIGQPAAAATRGRRPRHHPAGNPATTATAACTPECTFPTEPDGHPTPDDDHKPGQPTKPEEHQTLA